MNPKIALRRPAPAHAIGLAIFASLLTGTTLQAQNWTGSTSKFWNVATNWSTGALPTANQVATFDAVVSNLSMAMGSNMTVDGLYFTGNATQNYTLGTLNDHVLTLDGGAATDIKIDAGSGAHTLLSKLTLTGTHSWTNASSNAFSVAGDLSINTSTLTLSNEGEGGWIFGSADSQLTNLSNGDLSLIIGNTGAEVDLTLNGRVNITNSGSARSLRIQAAAGSVVNINAVLANNDGTANKGGGAFSVSHGGTVNLNVTKTYTNTTTINHNTTLNVNAAITNGGIWDIDGGTLNWNVTNTNMGGLYFGGGPQNSNSYLNIAEGVAMNLNGSVVTES